MPEPDHEMLHRAATPAYERIDRDLRRANEEAGRILAFVRRHLFDPRLNVDWILTSLKLSHNVSSRFRKEMGAGAKRYLEARRLETACRLLLDTDLEVRVVGELVGYRRFEAFSHAFKQRIGRRPKVYRDARRRSSLPAAARPVETTPRPAAGLPRFVAGTSALAAGARCARCGVVLETDSSARVFDRLEPLCALCALQHAPRELADFLFLNAPHLMEASLERLKRTAAGEGADDGGGR